MKSLKWHKKSVAGKTWKPARINVLLLGLDKPAPRPGWICDKLPGLAIVVIEEEEDRPRSSEVTEVQLGDPLFPKELSLTHIASGLRLAQDESMTTLAQVAVLSQEAYGVDWSLPKDELLTSEETRKFRGSAVACLHPHPWKSWKEWVADREEEIRDKTLFLDTREIEADQVQKLIQYFEDRAADDDCRRLVKAAGYHWTVRGWRREAEEAASSLRELLARFRDIPDVRFAVTYQLRVSDDEEIRTLQSWLAFDVTWRPSEQEASGSQDDHFRYWLPLMVTASPPRQRTTRQAKRTTTTVAHATVTGGER